MGTKLSKLLSVLNNWYETHQHLDPYVMVNIDGKWRGLAADVQETGEHRNAIQIAVEGADVEASVGGSQ